VFTCVGSSSGTCWQFKPGDGLTALVRLCLAACGWVHMSEFAKGEDYPTEAGRGWGKHSMERWTLSPANSVARGQSPGGAVEKRWSSPARRAEGHLPPLTGWHEAEVDDGSSLTTPGSDKWELGEGGGGTSSARGPTARVPRGWQGGTSSSRGARCRELLVVLEVGKGGMEDGCDEEREDADLRCHSGSFGFCISSYACCWTYYSRLRVSKIRMRGLLGPLLDIA
jgi:hypothetical protein